MASRATDLEDADAAWGVDYVMYAHIPSATPEAAAPY